MVGIIKCLVLLVVVTGVCSRGLPEVKVKKSGPAIIEKSHVSTKSQSDGKKTLHDCTDCGNTESTDNGKSDADITGSELQQDINDHARTRHTDRTLNKPLTSKTGHDDTNSKEEHHSFKTKSKSARRDGNRRGTEFPATPVKPFLSFSKIRVNVNNNLETDGKTQNDDTQKRTSHVSDALLKANRHVAHDNIDDSSVKIKSTSVANEETDKRIKSDHNSRKEIHETVKDERNKHKERKTKKKNKKRNESKSHVRKEINNDSKGQKKENKPHKPISKTLKKHKHSEKNAKHDTNKNSKSGGKEATSDTSKTASKQRESGLLKSLDERQIQRKPAGNKVAKTSQKPDQNGKEDLIKHIKDENKESDKGTIKTVDRWSRTDLNPVPDVDRIERILHPTVNAPVHDIMRSMGHILHIVQSTIDRVGYDHTYIFNATRWKHMVSVRQELTNIAGENDKVYDVVMEASLLTKQIYRRAHERRDNGRVVPAAAAAYSSSPVTRMDLHGVYRSTTHELRQAERLKHKISSSMSSRQRLYHEFMQLQRKVEEQLPTQALYDLSQKAKQTIRVLEQAASPRDMEDKVHLYGHMHNNNGANLRTARDRIRDAHDVLEQAKREFMVCQKKGEDVRSLLRDRTSGNGPNYEFDDSRMMLWATVDSARLQADNLFDEAANIHMKLVPAIFDAEKLMTSRSHGSLQSGIGRIATQLKQHIKTLNFVMDSIRVVIGEQHILQERCMSLEGNKGLFYDDEDAVIDCDPFIEIIENIEGSGITDGSDDEDIITSTTEAPVTTTTASVAQSTQETNVKSTHATTVKSDTNEVDEVLEGSGDEDGFNITDGSANEDIITIKEVKSTSEAPVTTTAASHTQVDIEATVQSTTVTDVESETKGDVLIVIEGSGYTVDGAEIETGITKPDQTLNNGSNKTTGEEVDITYRIDDEDTFIKIASTSKAPVTTTTVSSTQLNEEATVKSTNVTRIESETKDDDDLEGSGYGAMEESEIDITKQRQASNKDSGKQVDRLHGRDDEDIIKEIEISAKPPVTTTTAPITQSTENVTEEEPETKGDDDFTFGDPFGWFNDEPADGDNKNKKHVMQLSDSHKASFNDLIRERLYNYSRNSEDLFVLAKKGKDHVDELALTWEKVQGRAELLRNKTLHSKSFINMWAAEKVSFQAVHDRVISVSDDIKFKAKVVESQCSKAVDAGSTKLTKMEATYKEKTKGAATAADPKDVKDALDAVAKVKQDVMEIVRLKQVVPTPCQTLQMYDTRIRANISELRSKIEKAKLIASSLQMAVSTQNDGYLAIPVSGGQNDDKTLRSSLEVTIKSGTEDGPIIAWKTNEMGSVVLSIEDMIPRLSVLDNDEDGLRDVKAETPLTADSWYRILLERFASTYNLTAFTMNNPTPVTQTSVYVDKSEALQPDPSIVFISGLSDSYPTYGTGHWKGCFGDVILNGQKLTILQKDSSGMFPRACSRISNMKQPGESMVLDGSGFVRYRLEDVLPSRRLNSLYIQFIAKSDGVLLSMTAENSRVHIVAVIKNGKLSVHIRYYDYETSVISSSDIYNGAQDLRIFVQGGSVRRASVTLNNKSDVFNPSASKIIGENVHGHGLYLGGTGHMNSSMKVCIVSLTINERPAPIENMDEMKGVHFGKCDDNSCMTFTEASSAIELADVEKTDRLYFTFTYGSMGPILQYKKGKKFSLTVTIDSEGLDITESVGDESERIRLADFKDGDTVVVAVKDLDGKTLSVTADGSTKSISYGSGGFFSWGGGDSDEEDVAYEVMIGESSEYDANFEGNLINFIVNGKLVDLTNYMSTNNIKRCYPKQRISTGVETITNTTMALVC